MNNLFPPELRTASVVQRWSIVRKLQSDNVAEHSFFVTNYAVAIANLIKWEGPLDALMFAALLHDSEEFVTGDIVSPVKHGILDEDKFEAFIEDQMNARLPMMRARLQTILRDEKWGRDVQLIIKVADKVDAAIFLILEQRMGNSVLGGLINDALLNLKDAWYKLCIDMGGVSYSLWGDHIYPAVQAHHKYGSIGIHD